jgi:hypothetical protein
MFSRPKFITNSSSTSFVGYGVWIDYEERGEWYDTPDGINSRVAPGGAICVYINAPDIGIDKEGLLKLPPADLLQIKYKKLREFLDSKGKTHLEIVGVEGCWYNG